MTPGTRRFGLFLPLCLICGFLALTGLGLPAAAQDIQVTSADPNTAPQATVNLNVLVKGKGFKKGAVAKWLVTGTADPGGVTVNSTTFVNSTELVANIDVAEAAVISLYDIQVRNADGRIGKGTELFRVVAKGGGPACESLTLLTNLAPAEQLNPDPVTEKRFRGAFGQRVSVGQVDLNGDGNFDALVVAVGSLEGFGGGREVEVFLLNPTTGQVLLTHPHITLTPDPPDEFLEGPIVGDIDRNGVPDIVAGNQNSAHVYVFFGSVATGLLSYQERTRFQPPVLPQAAKAVGDLTGDGFGDVIMGDRSADVGNVRRAGKVFVFEFDTVSRTFSFFREITSVVSHE